MNAMYKFENITLTEIITKAYTMPVCRDKITGKPFYEYDESIHQNPIEAPDLIINLYLQEIEIEENLRESHAELGELVEGSVEFVSEHKLFTRLTMLYDAVFNLRNDLTASEMVSNNITGQLSIEMIAGGFIASVKKENDSALEKSNDISEDDDDYFYIPGENPIIDKEPLENNKMFPIDPKKIN